MTDTPETGRWAEVFGPRYAPVTIILCLGVALLAFNAFVTSTALPTAVQELGGVALISWALTLFLVFAIMGGAGAALAKQILGARTALLASSAVFMTGTLIAANAPSMEVVLLGRMLQGLGEGVVAAICFALIPELFPQRLVPKVFGIQAVVWAVAAFGGPLGAGLLTELITWRAAFLVSVPLALIFAGMVWRVVPNSKGIAGANADFPGLRLLMVGVAIMLVALASLAQPLQAAALLAAAAVLLVGMVLLDRRCRTRLLPVAAFGLGSVVGTGLWVVLLMPVAGATSAVYLVLLLQQLWGFGPALAGAFAAVLSVAWSLAAILVANVNRDTTRRRLIMAGPALLAIGLIGVLVGLLSGQAVTVVLAQLAMGAGFGLCNSSLYMALMAAAGDIERDRIAALVPTAQSAGNALGAALAGMAANLAGYATAGSATAIQHAIIPVFVLGAVVAALGLVAAMRMTGLIVAGRTPKPAGPLAA